MSMYHVRFVAGPALVNGQNIGGVFISQSTEIEADSRAGAYIRIYRHLSSQGDLTVACHGDGRLLGFTDNEVQEVVAAGIPFEEGLPRNGFQIEEIVECS